MEVAFESVAERFPLSMRTFLEFEQCNLWNVGRFRGSTGGDLDRKYLPESRIVFRLPCFSMARRHLYLYGAQRGSTGLRIGGAEEREAGILFPVHPAALGQYVELLAEVGAADAAKEDVRLLATPTSSTRTLLVWPDGEPKAAFFLKLSLPFQSYGDRRLGRRDVARSVGLSEMVQLVESELPLGVRYLPETMGLVARMRPDSGVVVRNIPDEVRDGRVVLAPMFALMGGSGTRRPLLLQLLEGMRTSAEEFLAEVVLARFARIWVDLVFDFGLILEAHGQDLLLALSPDLAPLERLYFRDFEGLAVDWALRRARGVPEPAWSPGAFEWFSTYETWGYPMYQLVSIKMMTSLSQFFDLMLKELESALEQWRAEGVKVGQNIHKGDLTFLFSRYLRGAIRQKFGLREREEYDIQQHLSRFVRFLMHVRRDVMDGAGVND